MCTNHSQHVEPGGGGEGLRLCIPDQLLELSQLPGHVEPLVTRILTAFPSKTMGNQPRCTHSCVSTFLLMQSHLRAKEEDCLMESNSNPVTVQINPAIQTQSPPA